jgi:hypothetical protein
MIVVIGTTLSPNQQKLSFVQVKLLLLNFMAGDGAASAEGARMNSHGFFRTTSLRGQVGLRIWGITVTLHSTMPPRA